MTFSRRKLLVGSTLLVADLTLGQPAAASTSLALTLPELRLRSKRVVLGRPVLHESEWVYVGGSKRIVTKTRILQERDWLVAQDEEEQNPDEFVVVTLGGRVGDFAQKVAGEARLPKNEPILLFIGEGADHEYRIVGMGQGAYPVVKTRAELRLQRSPQLPSLVGKRSGPDAPMHEQAAVDVLHDRTLKQAFSMIRGLKK